ncbi:MAG: Na+/H+ antiporter NhaA, partial [Pseudomonadota bacterium]
IALEIKSEACQGHFRNRSLVMLPIVAACGGMVVPALCYAFVTHGSAIFVKGWAIPIATDIAFSLGMLSLFGARVPIALKMFLMTLCVFDDMGAIVVIALFHSSHLDPHVLIISGIILATLFVINRLGIESVPMYLFLGFLLWLSILESGFNSTISGVLLGFFIPFKRRDGSQLIQPLIKDMQPFLTFFVLPLFAFANAGVSLSG